MINCIFCTFIFSQKKTMIKNNCCSFFLSSDYILNIETKLNNVNFDSKYFRQLAFSSYVEWCWMSDFFHESFPKWKFPNV